MTELVDVADLKSAAYNRAYGFDPRFRDHQPLSICRSSLRSRGFDDGQKKEIQYGLPCGLLFLYLQKTHSSFRSPQRPTAASSRTESRPRT